MIKKTFSVDDSVDTSLQNSDLVTLEKQAIANDDLPMLIKIYLKRFKQYFSEKKYSDSLIVLNDCETMLEQVHNEDLWIELLRCKSMIVALNFQLEKTVQTLPTVIKQAKSSESYDLLSLAYYLLSRCHASLGDLKRAILFAKMAWYYIKKVEEDSYEQEGIIISYYCLYLLELGEVNIVKQIIERHKNMLPNISLEVFYGTFAMKAGDVEQAIKHYNQFLHYSSSTNILIFLDFQLMHLENEVSSYLIKHSYNALHELYNNIIALRKRFKDFQFNAKQQDISTFRHDVVQLDNFILQGMSFIEQHIMGNQYICNIVVKVDEVDDIALLSFVLEEIQLQIQSCICKKKYPIIFAKIDFNTLYIVFLTKNIKQAQNELLNIDQIVDVQRAQNTGHITSVKTVLKNNEKTDFYEIYTNTVAKLFI